MYLFINCNVSNGTPLPRILKGSSILHKFVLFGFAEDIWCLSHLDECVIPSDCSPLQTAEGGWSDAAGHRGLHLPQDDAVHGDGVRHRGGQGSPPVRLPHAHARAR